MNAARIVVTTVAVAAAAFLAFRGLGGAREAPPGTATPAAVPPSPPAAPDDPSLYPSLTGGVPAAAPPGPAAPGPAGPKAPAAEIVDEDPAPGTPVRDGADVSVVVPYRTGTKSRYRVTESQRSKDLNTDAVQWFLFTWEVSTEVVSGDGTGPARIRFAIDAFEFGTMDPRGRPLRVSSRDADKVLLADPQFGRSLKPMMAVLGAPLEFAIGTGDEITGIEGVPAINRTFLDVVETFPIDFRKDTSDAPTTENLTQKWSEILFPPVGGGTLKAGAARDAAFRTVYYERWANTAAGKMRVTHDDAASFRVEFKGKPEAEELNREAKGDAARAIEKIRVVSSADSYRASWRFDRKEGRLLWGGLHAKFRVDLSRRVGVDANGAPVYDPHFTDIERQIVVELLDK